MENKKVSIVRYNEPYESVKKAVMDCGGMDHIKPGSKVFLKPNIVFWTKACQFPKWGVITTSRVIEAMIILLKEHGIEDITIGEGIVADPKDTETPAHAFETLGYENLRKKYNIKYINIMERPFQKIDLGDGITLGINEDILQSDYVINLPVLKSHNQTVVSLGTKNLKGTIDIPSRKKCHSPDPQKDLHFYISKIVEQMPPMLTLIDGIYSLERGPAFDGKMQRSDLLIASLDFLAADLVGTKVLGHEPQNVTHLANVAQNYNRPLDLSDVEIVGEKIEDVASYHEHDFDYSKTEEGEMPLPLAKQGIKGIFYRKFDETMCTYCSAFNGLILNAIRYAWKGEPWDNIEVLTGKAMKPTPGMNTTILLGQCMYNENKNDPNINNMIAVKGCPPDPQDVANALIEAGIDTDPTLFNQMDTLPGFFMSRYEGKPEFDESFFQVEGEDSSS